ncbi:helix-turn-helix domain-containing protein [Senimuribacter intestinalis]|uniref:helix-turn-helix domain-containing protein n=1 Tax=Senimuribacter intestinalis TaxID=2941507 RepID=UPI00203F4559|nr:helix-turn-helix transcriptional regulator [Senimuribacter intestinalis]
MFEISKRICDLIDASPELSDSKLAEYIGVNKSSVSQWRNQRSEPKSRYISDIADYLNVSTDYLLTGEEAESYYFDPEVSEMAQEMATRPELKVLFKASRNVSKESIEAINNMIQQMTKD